MEVGTQQQPVGRVVVLGAPVRLDVGRLDYVHQATACDHAAVAVSGAEGVAELLLPSPRLDLPQDGNPAVFVGRGVGASSRGVSVCLRPTASLQEAAPHPDLGAEFSV